MLAVEAKKKDAQKIKKYLVKNNLYNYEYNIIKENDILFFPLIEKPKDKKLKIVKKEFEKRHRKIKFKDFLFEHFTSKEMELLKTSFDVVGDIAILDIPDELKSRENLIAKTLLHANKNIKTVLKKVGIHEGKYRTQKTAYLAGEKKKKTLHKELGCRMILDVEKVYFSPRLGNERKTITKKIRPKESVLVMFSGCAPYPIVFSKNSKAKEIYAIELNPAAHKYAEKNILLNKRKNISLFKGDVKKVFPKLKKKFDRILMPLPKSAEEFLDTAFLASKKGTVIHFYDFVEEKDIPDASIRKIDKACKKAGLQYKVLAHRKCGQHAPYTFRICVDFQIK